MIYSSVLSDAAYKTIEALGIKPTSQILLISIAEQKLYHISEGQQLATYSISTGKKPPSCIENSFGTPLGLHQIVEKIGEGEPSGMVFKGRKPIGKHFSELPPEEQHHNLVTTRILRLRGLELGKNAGQGCDTFNRFVYIHGTNREDGIGTPMTAGCPVLSNVDIVTLFDAIPIDSLVYIGLE
jgi:hypothetical protein